MTKRRPAKPVVLPLFAVYLQGLRTRIVLEIYGEVSAMDPIVRAAVEVPGRRAKRSARA